MTEVERFELDEANRSTRDSSFLTVWTACRGGSSTRRLKALIEEEKARIWNQEKRKFNLDDRERETGQTMLHMASWNGYHVRCWTLTSHEPTSCLRCGRRAAYCRS